MSGKTKSRTLDKTPDKVKHQIGFVLGLRVLSGLSDSCNGVTMHICWKEQGSRSNYAQTSIKVVKKKEIEFGENLMFDAKLTFKSGKYEPAFLILSLRKVGSSSTVDRGVIHLHTLAANDSQQLQKVVFDKGSISLTYTAKATPKQIGNQKIIAPTSQVAVDDKHKIVSHGVEWATQTAKELTETAGGSFEGSDEANFNFADGPRGPGESPSPRAEKPTNSNFVPVAQVTEFKQKISAQEKELSKQRQQIDYLTQRDKEHLQEIKELKLKLAQSRQNTSAPAQAPAHSENNEELVKQKQKLKKANSKISSLEKKIAELTLQNEKLKVSTQ